MTSDMRVVARITMALSRAKGRCRAMGGNPSELREFMDTAPLNEETLERINGMYDSEPAWFLTGAACVSALLFGGLAYWLFF